jgi:hypothetical protein
MLGQAAWQGGITTHPLVVTPVWDETNMQWWELPQQLLAESSYFALHLPFLTRSCPSCATYARQPTFTTSF